MQGEPWRGGVCISCLSFTPPAGWERLDLPAQVLQPMFTMVYPSRELPSCGPEGPSLPRTTIRTQVSC